MGTTIRSTKYIISQVREYILYCIPKLYINTICVLYEVHLSKRSNLLLTRTGFDFPCI